MTCYFEPVKGPGNERRDELGNKAPYRKHPHRGSDYGFKGGSEGKDIWAIHSGTVTKVWNDPALGFSVIVKNDPCDDPSHAKDHIEYNHMKKASTLKVGDKVVGNKTIIGFIGATGSALSASGANHLHASVAPAPVPHVADYKLLKDLFKLVDKSRAERKAIKAAAEAAGVTP